MAKDDKKTESDFLVSMAHELRTPLNAILGYSEMLIEEAKDLEQEDFIPDLEKINRAGSQLLGLINDILDYSKIEAGKFHIEKIDFHLDELMEKLTNTLSTKIDEKDDVLLLDIRPDIPTALTGDPRRLSQILFNLCNTAITVGEAGAEMEVTAEQENQSEEQVVLRFSVHHSGTSISAEQQSGFFQAFGQADGATSRMYGGTGLGLTLSKRLTEMMGGKIWVESGPGKGATFHFTARLGKQQGEASGQEAIAKGRLRNREQAHVAIARLRGAHVLLVEDNEINQELAVGLLASNGITTEVANNGQEALDMLATDDFDGVLMDCQMPVMDGYTATRKIREQDQYKALPVIAMTANAIEEEREKVLDAGMNDHIAKPINVKQMLETMAQWIVPAVPATASDQSAVFDDVATTLPQQLPGIDIATGLARVQGNAKLYLKLLTRFRDSQKTFRDQFGQAQRADNSDAALRCAHTLKGLAGSIGASELEQSAEALERACRLGKGEIETLLEAVIARLRPVVEGLVVLTPSMAPRETGRADLNLAAVNPVLSKLRGLLEEDDADAAQVFEELESLLSGTPQAGDMQAIATHIGEFDFEAALEALDELENALP